MEPKDLINKVNGTRKDGVVQGLRRPKQEDEAPPTGPAMGTLSPELSEQVRGFKDGRRGD